MTVTNGYAIVCDARTGGRLGIETLALVDRSRCKSQWWTSDNAGIAICYASLGAARFAARRLRHNRARVVHFDLAASRLREQAAEILYHDAMSEAEQGWDAHKDY